MSIVANASERLKIGLPEGCQTIERLETFATTIKQRTFGNVRHYKKHQDI